MCLLAPQGPLAAPNLVALSPQLGTFLEVPSCVAYLPEDAYVTRTLCQRLTIIQLTFLNDVLKDRPSGPAQLAWTNELSIISEEHFWLCTSWGRHSNNLTKVPIVIGWGDGLLLEGETTPAILRDIDSTNPAYPLSPILPYLLGAPRVYNTSLRGSPFNIKRRRNAPLDIIYVQMPVSSDVEDFVENIRFRELTGRGALVEHCCVDVQRWPPLQTSPGHEISESFRKRRTRTSRPRKCTIL